MKIIYVYRGIPALTQAIHIEGLMRELRALGHQVEPCFPVPQSEAGIPSRSPLTRALQWTRERIPAGAWNLLRLRADVRTAQRLRRLVAITRPDAIYERYVFMSGGCVRVANELAVPHIFEVNETARLSAESWSEATRARAYRMEDEAFARSGALIAVSGVLRDHVISLGVRAERVTVMHNGVHAEDFADAAAHRGTVRRAYGFADRFAIGYLQSWHATSGLYKQISTQLSALIELLLPAAASAALVMIGGGAAWEQVRDHLLRHSPNPERVLFTGPVGHAEIPRLLAALDAGLIVHHQQFTSPLKLFEYMAAGLPVVAPALPNIAEVIREGENGVLFPPGNIQDLAHRITDLASDPESARRLGEVARREALKKYTWRANAEGVVRIAQRLAD